jgi:Protein of unknown function (DUF4236)
MEGRLLGFRFRKSIKVAPGVRINLSGHGLSSVTVGRRGVVSPDLVCHIQIDPAPPPRSLSGL